MIRGSHLLFFLSLCLLQNCAVGPHFKKRPTLVPKTYPITKLTDPKTVATPTKFGQSQYLIPNKDIPTHWWTLFHSTTLNELIRASLKHNPNVGVAQAALRASLENVYAQKGAFYPFIGASFTGSPQKTARILQSVLADNKYDFSLYTGQLYVSYTLDLFGGVRRQLESSIAAAEFQRLQLEATYLTLSSNVAYAFIQEACLREQIDATKEIVASQKKILLILKQQLNLGDTPLATVSLQESALANSEATLIPLQKQLTIQQNLLNTLTGRFPDETRMPKIDFNSLHLPQDLPISLPSSLLEHRPDIRAAEEQMRAANAMVGVTIANRLPNITIGSTNVGTAALSLSTLLAPNTQFWQLAGIVTQPVFAGGTLMHRQRMAEAIYDEAVAQYRLTIINAFQNVADTLTAIQKDALALRAAYKAERAAFKNLRITRQQKNLGENSALSVLLSEQNHLQAKLNLIQAQANRLSDTVALFQALGGGWWHKELSRC